MDSVLFGTLSRVAIGLITGQGFMASSPELTVTVTRRGDSTLHRCKRG